jgi:Ca2+/Na+ antiporter
MSFSGQAILALHIAAAIFALGPGTAAIMSTPRYIRKGNAAVVGFLYRTTRIYAIGSVLVLVFGLILTQIQHEFSKWWISVSITLYVVAAVLLVMILRDQRRAMTALKSAAASATGIEPGTGTPVGSGTSASTAVAPASHPLLEDGNGQPPAERSAEEEEENGAADGEKQAAVEHPAPASPAPASAAPVAAVERARISSLSGVIALIWLVTLVLMVWK